MTIIPAALSTKSAIEISCQADSYLPEIAQVRHTTFLPLHLPCQFRLGVTRRGDAEGEAINLLAADGLTGSRLVTAVRTANGNLKVIVWSVSADGNSVTQLSEREAGEVRAISLIKLTNTRFATAVRTSEDNLRLIIWEVSADGSSISLLAHEFAGAIADVSLARLSINRLATALRIASYEQRHRSVAQASWLGTRWTGESSAYAGRSRCCGRIKPRYKGNGGLCCFRGWSDVPSIAPTLPTSGRTTRIFGYPARLQGKAGRITSRPSFQ